MKTSAAIAEQECAYDAVPYSSHSYTHTHPDHLAVVGSLFGVKTPALETARVLELGSASGGNILPLAQRYPKADFTGIDLSRAQVAEGEAHVAALGFKNVRFRQQDILALDLKANRGAFDYIICHGVYSWVPDEVSARILDIFRECLSENGLAMVSYNTLPGWNAVRSLREMMRFHTDRFTTPAETAEARRLLRFLADAAPPGGSYKSAIDEEIKMISSLDDSYLYHDHLEGINRQFYFHQFVADAKTHGLGYVGDSSFTAMFTENLSPTAAQSLSAINDLMLQEQYADFVVNRRFRCSILCREGVALTRAMRDIQILDYHITSGMRPVAPVADFRGPVKFALRQGSGVFTALTEASAVVYDEIVKSGARPIAAVEAIRRAEARLPNAPQGAVRAALLENGLRLALRGFINLHMNSPAFVDSVSEKPVVAPLARLQAAQPGCSSVTNLLGAPVRIEGFGTRVLPLFDGSRTLNDIAATLPPGNRQAVAKVAEQLAAQALLCA